MKAKKIDLSKKSHENRELVETSTQNHRIILLFKIVEIFKYHQIQKFTNNTDLRKQEFLSKEKVKNITALKF